MLKKTIKFTDYDGNIREEDYYFNLTKPELIKMRFSENGGLENLISRIIKEQDNAKLLDLFEEVVLKSYGKKSLDGKRFEKSEELTNEFIQSEAYTELYMELLDGEKCAAFFNAIIPQDIASEIEAEEKKKLALVSK